MFKKIKNKSYRLIAIFKQYSHDLRLLTVYVIVINLTIISDSSPQVCHNYEISAD